MLKFPREIGLKRAVCTNRRAFASYVKTLGNKSSCYTSLYAFQEVDNNNRINYDSVVIDRAWWDFDSDETDNIEEVKEDVQILLSRLNGSDIRLVATGRGFHVHQLFKQPVYGRAWNNRLQRYERYMARGLKTLDGVGYAEKLTRIPDTYNPKRKRWCVTIDVEDFLANPHTYHIPKSPVRGIFKKECPFRIEKDLPKFDLTEWFDRKSHILEEVHIEEQVDLDITEGNLVPLTPCLGAINDTNPAHYVRMALVQHMAEFLRDFTPRRNLTKKKLNEIENTICSYIESLGWRDYRPSITRHHVRDIINSYDRSPTCRWFVDKNMCKGKCWRYDGTVKLI